MIFSGKVDWLCLGRFFALVVEGYVALWYYVIYAWFVKHSCCAGVLLYKHSLSVIYSDNIANTCSSEVMHWKHTVYCYRTWLAEQTMDACLLL